jgi:hypothetical protein
MNETILFWTKCVVSFKKKRMPKHVNFQISPQFFICSIKYSIEILILIINSIASLPNSNISSKVGRLFHFDSWFWICVFWPSFDQQTSKFFNLAPNLVNFSPYISLSFPIWSLVLDFFNQVPNCPSNFNIYAIKP